MTDSEEPQDFMENWTPGMRAIHTRGLISKKSREVFDSTPFGELVKILEIHEYAVSKAKGLLTEDEILEAIKSVAQEYASRGEYIVREVPEGIGIEVCRKPSSEVQEIRKKARIHNLKEDWQIYASYLIEIFFVVCALYLNIVAPGSANPATSRMSIIFATSGFCLCLTQYLVNGMVGGWFSKESKME